MAAPPLSVVVASGAGGEFLFRCLDSLGPTAERLGVELIVVDRVGASTRARVREQHPGVRVIAAEGVRPSVPALRAAGVDAASAPLVAMLEEHCVAGPDWLARLLDEFEPADVALGGPILDDDYARLCDWVVYFSEYHDYLPPWRRGEERKLNGANVAYRCEALRAHRTELEEGYWEVVLHPRLAQEGGRLRAVPELGVRHTGPFDYRYYLRQRYLLSRVWGGTQREREPWLRRALHLLSAPVFPFFLLARMGRRASGDPRLRRRFLAALPLLLPVVIAYTWGEWLGYLLGPGRALEEVE